MESFIIHRHNPPWNQDSDRILSTISENPTLISDLPQAHVVSCSQLSHLRLEALQISKWFEDHTDSNQWIVVRSLSTPVIEALTSDHGGLEGITFRFQ